MQEPQNQEALSVWVRERFQEANKYLAENGVIYDSVDVQASRYLAPYFSVWKIKSLEGESFWVLVGDLPSDFSPLTIASNAREALRHFSLTWQIRAENLLKNRDVSEEQKNYASMLINRAEGLYSFYNDEEFWNQE